MRAKTAQLWIAFILFGTPFWVSAANLDPCSSGYAKVGSSNPARSALSDFLQSHQVQLQWLDDSAIGTQDFFRTGNPIPALSQFSSTGDTLFYSQLIGRLLGKIDAGKAKRIIDLGAGSSIPTLRALLEHPEHSGLRVIAVDIDASALNVSRKNASDLGIGKRYTFVRKSIPRFLRGRALAPTDIIASNPPYLPAPAVQLDRRFIPVSAGTDGTLYLDQILNHPMPPGTHVALVWSSLSNPEKMLSTIAKHYDVVEVLAAQTPFGAYTSSPQLLPHIREQASRGLADFREDENGQRSYTIVGTVLRRK